MQGTFITIKPGSGGLLATPIDGEPTLPAVKAAIGGGYIEEVKGFTTIEHGGKLHTCVVFCDEDGKRKQLPLNKLATTLWDQALRRIGQPTLARPDGSAIDFLVGQVLVVIGDQEFLEAL